MNTKHSDQMRKQMNVYVFIFIYALCNLPGISNKKYFQSGGVGKLLSKKKRNIFVEQGQEARLKWEFKVDKNIKFEGIKWKFYDNLNVLRRLIWMDTREISFQPVRAIHRTEYNVHLEEQATLVIPNVKRVHENTYICIVQRTGLDNIFSEVSLKVTEGKLPMPPMPPTRDVYNPTKTFSCTESEGKPTMPSIWNVYNSTKTSLSFTESGKPTLTSISSISRYNATMRNTQSISIKTDNETGTKYGGNHKMSRDNVGLTKISIYILSGTVALILIIIIITFGIKKFKNGININRSESQEIPLDILNETSSLTVGNHSESSDQITDISWSEDNCEEYDETHYLPRVTFPRPLQLFNDGNPIIPPRRTYEIDRGLIINFKRIGEGAFGVVEKADFVGSKKCTVAVKRLKVFASPDDKRDLISEFKLMKRIDSHKNVVKLLGCVMTSEPILVVIEYVIHGDLLGFLRKSRGLIDTIYDENETIPCTNLTQSQLLKMAKDVASGMVHLSHNQIIHRDLAARNVLVGKHIQCKITDFGMARDVKSSNYYRTKNRGRIPLKWTAIEAIVGDKYTIASDVWSFGVLLYEIVTIGGQPYPGMGVHKLILKLQNGWRMGKPPHVDLELYKIMQQCWKKCPDERPTFIKLQRTFSKLYGGDSDYINMKDYDDTLYGNAEDTPENSSTFNNEVSDE